jgi:hypothetical protein
VTRSNGNLHPRLPKTLTLPIPSSCCESQTRAPEDGSEMHAARPESFQQAAKISGSILSEGKIFPTDTFPGLLDFGETSGCAAVLSKFHFKSKVLIFSNL